MYEINLFLNIYRFRSSNPANIFKVPYKHAVMRRVFLAFNVLNHAEYIFIFKSLSSGFL